MSKSKGNSYEYALIKQLEPYVDEVWRVPLSGAIGENLSAKVPERVRRYLIGDICFSKYNQDYPVEVKFRKDASGFKTFIGLPVGVYEYQDAIVFIGTHSFFDLAADSIIIKENILNKTLTDWLDKVNILALKSKLSKHWIFVRRK